MIFVQALDGTMFLMLSEKDVQGLRQGQTRFVDGRQLGQETFSRVIVSLNKTDTESLELIRQAGHHVPQLKVADPAPNETPCIGCGGLIETCQLFQYKCITCLAFEVKKLRLESN